MRPTMRVFACTRLTIGRQAVLTVIVLTGILPASAAQQSVTGVNPSGTKCLPPSSERAGQPIPAKCYMPDGAAVANGSDPYEQNQLGIASALVLGPQRTIGEARKWFEE